MGFQEWCWTFVQFKFQVLRMDRTQARFDSCLSITLRGGGSPLTFKSQLCFYQIYLMVGRAQCLKGFQLSAILKLFLCILRLTQLCLNMFCCRTRVILPFYKEQFQQDCSLDQSHLGTLLLSECLRAILIYGQQLLIMTSENLNNRIETIRKKYTKKFIPSEIPTILLRDSISTSFYEANHSLNQLAYFSSAIMKTLHKKGNTEIHEPEKTRTNKEQTLQQNIKSIPNQPIKPTSLFDKIDLKKLGSIEKLDGQLIDIQCLFNKVPVPVSAVIQIDCSLKEESVCFLPFQRRDKFQELKQLSLKQQDNSMKSLFQYKVHNLTFRQFADIIGLELFQVSQEEPYRPIQFVQNAVIHIRSNKQYELLLKQFRNFQKFFFQGKRSMGTQLKLGQLLTEEQISFDNLMQIIQKICQILEKSQKYKRQDLKNIYKVINQQAELRLEELVTFLVSDFNVELQFHEIFVIIYKFKKLLLTVDLKSYSELINYTKGHSSFLWVSNIKQYLFGLPIKNVFNLILRCARLIGIRRVQSQNHSRKASLRSIVQKN